MGSSATLVFEVLKAAAKEFGKDRVNRMAAAIAYRTMFALTPLFLLAVAVFGTVVGSNATAREQILTSVEDFAGPQVSSALSVFLNSVEVSGNTAAVLGVALLLWTASSLFMEVQRDLNDIFDVEETRVTGPVAFLRKRGIGVLWVIGLGLVLSAVWLLNAVWRFLGDLFPENLDQIHTVIGWLTPLVSVVVVPLIFALVFQTMTAVTVRWRAVWWGSFFTSVVFLAAAYGVGLYFRWGSGTSAITVAGSFFVVLLLAFILSAVFLFGAEVTKVYNDLLTEGEVEPAEGRSSQRPRDGAEDDSLPGLVVLAFLGGLAIGWRRSRR